MAEKFKCCACHQDLETIIKESDLLLRGKNVLCPYCQTVLWVVIESQGVKYLLSSQLPYILLPEP